MRSEADLHPYQRRAVEFVFKQPKCALFMGMGLGKTVVTLTAIKALMDDLLIRRALVIAPLRVANTVWKQEAAQWSHLKGLKVVICTGTAKQRLAALEQEANIYVINRENVTWLIENTTWKYGMLVVDESSSFKSYAAKRFKSLRRAVKHLKACVLLTGTPSPNSLMDLWPQICLIDNGKRLGRNITIYRKNYFRLGYDGFTWELLNGARDAIYKLLEGICMTMKSEDYIDLPDKLDHFVYVDLPDKAMAMYKKIKKEHLLRIGRDYVDAATASIEIGKLAQMANGNVYGESGTHHLHDAKLTALREIMDENPDENLLVAYQFRSDRDMIMRTFPEATLLSKEGTEIADWNKGKIKMLVAHPASAGHGLNLQSGGNMIVWYGLTWSLELYQQFNARLYRQGQGKPVTIIHIMARGTVDNAILQVIKQKGSLQDGLLEHLKESDNVYD